MTTSGFKFNNVEYDLNSLFNMQYSFDLLKTLLEAMGKSQHRSDQRLQDLEDRIEMKDKRIEDLEKQVSTFKESASQRFKNIEISLSGVKQGAGKNQHDDRRTSVTNNRRPSEMDKTNTQMQISGSEAVKKLQDQDDIDNKSNNNTIDNNTIDGSDGTGQKNGSEEYRKIKNNKKSSKSNNNNSDNSAPNDTNENGTNEEDTNTNNNDRENGAGHKRNIGGRNKDKSLDRINTSEVIKEVRNDTQSSHSEKHNESSILKKKRSDNYSMNQELEELVANLLVRFLCKILEKNNQA